MGNLPPSSSRESLLRCSFTSTGLPGMEGALQMQKTGLRVWIRSPARCPAYSAITAARTAPKESDAAKPRLVRILDGNSAERSTQLEFSTRTLAPSFGYSAGKFEGIGEAVLGLS